MAKREKRLTRKQKMALGMAPTPKPRTVLIDPRQEPVSKIRKPSFLGGFKRLSDG